MKAYRPARGLKRAGTGLSAATKKMWAEHREERRAKISAGVRRYWDAVRQCEVTIDT
jgi:hypothetical protein